MVEQLIEKMVTSIAGMAVCRLQTTAVHESGHAVCCYVLGIPIVEAKVIISSRGMSGAVSLKKRPGDDRVLVGLAGAAAVRLFKRKNGYALPEGIAFSRALYDCRKADIERSGQPSAEDIEMIEEAAAGKALPLPMQRMEEAEQLIDKNWLAVDALAVELMRRGTMTAREIEAVLQDRVAA